MATDPLNLDGFLSRHSLEDLKAQLYQDKVEKYGLGIKLLALIGAFIGACLLLLFLFLADLVRSEQSLFTMGVVFWIGSLAMSYIKDAKGLMYEPFLLVLGIMGQLMMAIGGESLFHSEYKTLGLYILFSGVEVITLLVSKNIVMHFLAATSLPCLLVGLFWTLGVYESIHFFVGFTAWAFAWIWSKESFLLSNFSKQVSYFYPVGFGWALALVFILATNVYKEFSEMYFRHWWVSSVLIWALLWQQVRYVVDVLQIASRWHIPIYLTLILLLSPTIFTPGISLSLLIILVGFRVGNNWLTIWGTIALLFFVNAFYYNLHLTLLLKSVTMMIAGILFLALFYIIKKWKQS